MLLVILRLYVIKHFWINQNSKRFGLRKLNDFPSRNGGKGLLIGSRNALDFESGMNFPAATVEKERLKTRASEVGRYLHRKLNEFPSGNVGK